MADDPLKDSVEDTQDIAKNIDAAIKRMFAFGDATVDVEDKVKKLNKAVQELVSEGSDPGDITKSIQAQSDAAAGQVKALTNSLKILENIQGKGTQLNSDQQERYEIYQSQIKQLSAQKAILDEVAKSSGNISDSFSMMRGIGSRVLNDTKILGEEFGRVSKLVQNIAGSSMVAFAALIAASLERWKALDKAAGDFRDSTGLIVSQTREIDRAVRQVNVDMQQFGVTLEAAYKSAGELYRNFGTTALVTKELIASTAQLEANLGVASSDTAKFVSMFGAMSKAATGTETGLVKAAAALAEMGGVAPAEVMKDIASASGATLSFLGRSPMALMRASVEARRLGTSIKSISDSARGMLDYQTSINSELEASALLGQSVSFQESRLLAYQGKIVESRKAALNQISKAGDFTKLNVYQQEALAKAAGMTVDEVMKQQNQEKMLNAVRRGGTAEQKAQLAKYEEMSKKIATNEAAAQKDLVARGEEMVKQQLRQTEMNKLSNAFSAIWVDITDALLPIANAIMPVIVTTARVLGGVFKIIGALIGGILAPFDKIGEAMRNSGEGGLTLEKVMTSVGNTIAAIVPYAKGLGMLFGTLVSFGATLAGVFTFLFRSMKVVDVFAAAMKPLASVTGFFMRLAEAAAVFGGRLTGIWRIFSPIVSGAGTIFKSLGFISKFLGPIGLVINAIQFVYNLVQRLMKIDTSKGFWNTMWEGIKAIGGALYDTLIQPFVDLWDWCSEHIFGHSPSLLGELIVNGIKAVTGVLFDIILSPFQMAWEGISSLFSTVGPMMIDGIKSAASGILGFITAPFTQAWELIKKLPFVDKLFGGSKDATKGATAEAQSSIDGATSTVVEVKNLDALQGVVQQLTDAVLALGGAVASSPATGGTTNNSGVEAKLDELINLMRTGGIAVNMDGKKVSSAIAVSGT